MSSLRVVVTGAGGQVGTRVVRLLRGLSVPIEVFPVDSRALDVTARDQVHALVAALRPDWIVNCAAYTAVDRAESEKWSRQENGLRSTGSPGSFAPSPGAVSPPSPIADERAPDSLR